MEPYSGADAEAYAGANAVAKEQVTQDERGQTVCKDAVPSDAEDLLNKLPAQVIVVLRWVEDKIYLFLIYAKIKSDLVFLQRSLSWRSLWCLSL